MYLPRGSNSTSRWMILVIAPMLLLSIGLFIHEAFAEGPDPSTCPNRYDGPITSATIIAGGNTYDPIANPNVTFQLASDQSYNVTFTIHTPAQSSQGNSDPGTVWYRFTALGFADDVCVNNVGPNQDVTISLSIPYEVASQPPIQQNVEFGTTTNFVAFSYIVNWVNPENIPAISQLTINSQDNTGNAITGFFTALSQNGNQIATGFTPASFTLNNNQIYAVSIASFGKYIFDHWADTGSTSATRDISITSNSTITAVYKTVPQPPTGLTATAKILKIGLRWYAPNDNGGSAITGYMIERSTDNGNTWSVIVANTGSAGTTYYDTNVQLLKTYTYRVSAINDVGTSNPSNTASATTPSVGPITPSILP